MRNESNARAESIGQRIAGLSSEKRQILEEALRRKGQTGAEPAIPRSESSIPRRTSNEALPLSFAQQRIWFLDQFAPGSPFYNVDNALRIRFPLSVEALERSYNETVRRHEALRTTFQSVGGKPVQVIADSLQLPMEVRDLRHLPLPERETEALRVATEEARRPFDLARGPLVRTALIQMGAADYLLLLSMHHIISDGWSMNVFAREIATLYPVFCLGQASPLPPLPIQYADFAVWQREWLRGEVFERQLAYWKKQLADLPVLRLPTDRPRAAVMTYRGTRAPITIPGELSEKLKLLSQREGVTLFMTLLAAFQTLLHRYTGQEDIVTGAPTSNRNRAELEGLIGFFVNTLVIRTSMAGNPTFRELLARVRHTALDAYANDDLPFEKLVEELHPERDLSRNPLFQVCFQLFNVHELEESVFQPMTIQAGIAKFDLRLDLLAGPRDLKGFFEYSTDLFDAPTIEGMTRHFLALLEAIADNSGQRLAELSLLGPAERRQCLVEWNETKTAFPLHCVHELFEAQVQRSPDAIAVAFGDEQLTYRGLNRRANRLARDLRSRGVDVDIPVGVFLERSLDMVIAQLAILKAGGAYVPLDPEYPRERLAFVLADSGARLLLAHDRSRSRLPESAAQVVSIDRPGPGDAACENLQSEAHVDSLAYVMYTSGSTGAPKGIAIPHRAISRLVCSTNYISLGPSDRLAQASNASFDAATFEIWGALLNGACLVGVPKDVLLSPRELASLL